MGEIKQESAGREKRRKNGKLVFMALFMACSLLLTSCQPEQEEKPDKKAHTAVQKEKETTVDSDNGGAIPDELLPGQDEMQADAQETTKGTTEKTSEKSSVYDAGGGKTPTADNQASQGTDSGREDSAEPQRKISVEFSIDSSAASNEVSYQSKLTLEKGATVYDALEASGVDFTGIGYVTGIGGLFEKDYGPGSGWKYFVNGTEPGKSSNKYTLQDGDKVQWKYVLNP